MSEEKKSDIPLEMPDETRKKVAAFLAEQQAAAAQAAPKPPTEDDRIKVGHDDTFDENPEENFIRSALIDTRQVELTQADKDLFMKALLNDKPVELDITLFDGKLTLHLRSRTMFEQRRVIEFLRQDEKDKLLVADPAAAITRLQQYLCAIMIKTVNGQNFSTFDLEPTSGFEVNHETVKKFIAEKLENMTQIRWDAFLNALRIFEEKCRRLSEYCANEDFWRPPGQD